MRYALLTLPLLCASTQAQAQDCTWPTADVVFCSDFEEGNKDVWDDYDGNTDPGNQLIEDPGPFARDGNHVIRLRSSDLIKVLPRTGARMYARWYMNWEAAYDFHWRNHGSGLFAGDRNSLGISDYRPTDRGEGEWFGTYIEPAWYDNLAPAGGRLAFYTYYLGMYQDCNPNGACWGDHLPCMMDDGSNYCEKAEHRETLDRTPPVMENDRWYCIEIMADAGTPVGSDGLADGTQNFWVDSVEYGPFENLWHRATSQTEINILWLSLYLHDGQTSAGIMIDDVVVSESPIGCISTDDIAPAAPSNLVAR